MTYVKQLKGWRMNCGVDKAREMLENELILQAFRRFTYVTAHFPTLPSHYLRHSSFSNPSIASPTSQLILQPFFCFSYVTGFSLTLSGEPPMTSLEEHWICYFKINIQHFCTKEFLFMCNLC